MIICKQQQIMKKMSKTKLTYITPVLDFVQAESEGGLLTVSGTGPDAGFGEGDSGPDEGFGDGNSGNAKDFHFQFDDSDADFFYLD